MVSTGDVVSILGTRASPSNFMKATYDAAKKMGLTDQEATYLAYLDSVDEARVQGAPGFVVNDLQLQAQNYLQTNAGALAGLMGTPGIDPSVTGATQGDPAATTISPLTGTAADIAGGALVGQPGATGELNIPYGSDFLPYALDAYIELTRMGQQRDLTMEELTFQREVEARLQSEGIAGRDLQNLLSQRATQLEYDRLGQQDQQFGQQQQLNQFIAQNNQQEQQARRGIDIASIMANLRANPLSAAESAFFTDEIGGGGTVGPNAGGIAALLGRGGGVQVSAPGGSPNVNNLLARSTTQGGGGTTAVGLGGLELPRTLSGGQLNGMTNNQQGVYQSFAAAGGNAGALERSIRALLPNGFSPTGA